MTTSQKKEAMAIAESFDIAGESISKTLWVLKDMIEAARSSEVTDQNLIQFLHLVAVASKETDVFINDGLGLISAIAALEEGDEL